MSDTVTMTMTTAPTPTPSVTVTNSSTSSSSSSTLSSDSRKVIVRESAKADENVGGCDSEVRMITNRCTVQAFNRSTSNHESSKVDRGKCSSSSLPLEYFDWRYVTSFHGFLKATALVSCLGVISCAATVEQCWFEAGMALNILCLLSTISAIWTLAFYGGHLVSLQRRFCQQSKTSIVVVFADLILSAFSFVSMMVSGFVTANSGCRIERSSVIGSAGFGILASFLYFVNFAWLTWKYYLDCNLIVN